MAYPTFFESWPVKNHLFAMARCQFTACETDFCRMASSIWPCARQLRFVLTVGIKLQRRLDIGLSQDVLNRLRIRPAIHKGMRPASASGCEAKTHLPIVLQLLNPSLNRSRP